MKDYTISKIKSSIGKEFIKKYHYSHGCHNGPMCYGLFDEDILIGVIAFATPCSENVRSSIFGEQHKNSVTELHRLVILDVTPKNTESWFISRALKLLKQDKPNILGVISFADSTEGHKGTIYQATNALYLGTSSPTIFYIDQTGRLRHPRQNGVNITKVMAKALGWEPTKRNGKYRYLFLLPDRNFSRKKLIKMLLLKQEKYIK